MEVQLEKTNYLVEENIEASINHCVICKMDIQSNKPLASKNVYQDFSIKTFKQLSEVICSIIKKHPNQVTFVVSIFDVSVFIILDTHTFTKK